MRETHPLVFITTTLFEKSFKGTVVIPLPNGKKVIDEGQSADEPPGVTPFSRSPITPSTRNSFMSRKSSRLWWKIKEVTWGRFRD